MQTLVVLGADMTKRTKLMLDAVAVSFDHPATRDWLAFARDFRPMHVAVATHRPDHVLRLLREGERGSQHSGLKRENDPKEEINFVFKKKQPRSRPPVMVLLHSFAHRGLSPPPRLPGHDPRALTTRNSAPTPLQLALDVAPMDSIAMSSAQREVRRIMSMAAKPWTPSTHFLFGPKMRRYAIITIMLAKRYAGRGRLCRMLGPKRRKGIFFSFSLTLLSSFPSSPFPPVTRRPPAFQKNDPICPCCRRKSGGKSSAVWAAVWSAPLDPRTTRRLSS